MKYTTEIQKISPEQHRNQKSYTPPSGWVILGIEQRRQWPEENCFEDETTYIIGKQPEED